MDRDPLRRLFGLRENRGYFTSENAKALQLKGSRTRAVQHRVRASHQPPLTRVCRKCGASKLLGKFMASKNCLWGRTYTCKPCYRDQGRQWRANNPGWAAANARRWRRKNPIAARAMSARYRAKDPGKARERSRQSYERFRADPRRWAMWKEYARRYMAERRATENPERAAERLLYRLVEESTQDVPEVIRDAVRQEIFLKVYLGEVRRMSLRSDSAAVKAAIRHAWKESPNQFSDVSLDAPLGEDGDLTLADLIADDDDAA